MATTFTASTFPNALRPATAHSYWQTAIVTRAITSTTASDRFLMLQVPGNATIMDGYIVGEMGPASGTIFKIGLMDGGGTGSTMSGTMASNLTLSGTSQLQRFNSVPVLIPSITATFNWVAVEITTGASGSSTFSFLLAVHIAPQGNL